MPMKPTKRAIKVWVIACSETGYMVNFKIYEGKHKREVEVTGEKNIWMRQNRKHYPKDLLQSDKLLKTGQSDYASFNEISICKGKKSVIIGSNVHKEASIVNSYICYKKASSVNLRTKPMSHLRFRSLL
ncbi:hypothetical protein NQ318_019468, partial [Aromia moschata]